VLEQRRRAAAPGEADQVAGVDVALQVAQADQPGDEPAQAREPAIAADRLRAPISFPSV
jgi:hypothetical protein